MRIAPLAIPLAAVLLNISTSVSQAADAAFRSLMVEPAVTKDDACRNGIIAHRIEKWRKKDSLASSSSQAFMSVEEIVKDVMPDAIRSLQDPGCDPRYLRGFMACTGLDDPGVKSEHIVSSGVTAETDEEMAVIMKECIDEIGAAGVSPAL